MLEGCNLEEIKSYNASLKQYRDRAASLKAEIEYTNKELDTLCAELTAELGKQVTRDNIEQVYNEQISMINSTLQSGKAVLSKIAAEESNSGAAGQVGQAPVMNQTASQPTGQPVNNQYAAPQGNVGAAQNICNSIPGQLEAAKLTGNNILGSVPGGVFNGAATPSSLPPMFNL